MMRSAAIPIVLSLGFCSPAGPGADVVLRGGNIYTSSGAQPIAEALAIEGEALVAVGSNEEMDRFIGRNTIIVELDGRSVLPGFNDTDVDLFKGSVDIGKAQLDEARSIQEIQDILMAYAEAHPQTPWIFGARWQAFHLGSGRGPNRYDLDEVVSDRPVLIESHDGLSVLLNSRALEAAGIHRYSELEGNVRIQKDPTTGEPTGLLRGMGALASLRLGTLPRLSKPARLEDLRRGIAYLHRFGITAIHTAVGDLASNRYQLLEDLEKRAELSLRTHMIFTVTKGTTDSELEMIEQIIDRYHGPWLTSGGVRIELDGEADTHEVVKLDSFKGGELILTENDLNVLGEKLDRHRIPVTFRVNGGRAVRMALDAIENTALSNSTVIRRHRLEGVDTIFEEDIPRLSGLGLTISVQPSRASPDFISSWERTHLTESFLFASLAASGARLAFGSHWPAFDLDPVIGIHTAVTRQDLDGKPERGWNPDERMTLEQAIAAYTTGGAYCGFAENVQGSLEKGKLADLVVLSEDIFRIPERRIAEVEAVMTIVGGQAVYVSPGFLPEETQDSLAGRSYNAR